MAPTRVVLDVDTGADDALALLLATRCPELQVIAVTCVSGNVNVDQVLFNTLRVLDAAEAPAGLPVARGFSAPLVEPIHHCPEIHGQDGLGDLTPPVPASSRKPCQEHAVQLLRTVLQEEEKPIDVVALGPLTNIAILIRMYPELVKSKVARIVWMGGCVAAGGNTTQWGEANAAYDPEAAHILLTSGIPLLMYPWDVFLKVAYTRDELQACGVADGQDAAACRTSASHLAGQLMYREMRVFGTDEAVIGDAGAVAAAVVPGATTVRDLHVAVEMQGRHTRGMTVCDLRDYVAPPDLPKEPPNCKVVVDVDAAALKRFFSRHVFGVNDGDDERPRKVARAEVRLEG